MAEHRSLDEFATAPPDEDEAPDPTDLDALVRTYRWSSGGATCTGCGATTEPFWIDGERLVCPDCKDW